MPATTRRALLGTTLALIALPAAAQHAPAAVTAGDLSITLPWTRAAGATGTGVGFLTIRNTGSQPDRLISASTPVARVVELHTHLRDGDIMRMRPAADIPIPAGGTVQLRPGGLHIMMIGLTQALRQGTEVPLTLRFERAGEVQVMLHVQSAGARAPAHAH